MVEVAVALSPLEDDIGAQQRQDASEPLASYQHFCGHNLVAQADGFVEQLAVEVHVEQSLLGRIP